MKKQITIKRNAIKEELKALKSALIKKGTITDAEIEVEKNKLKNK